MQIACQTSEPDIIVFILDILILYRKRASLCGSRCFICSPLITLRKKTNLVPVPGTNLLEATAERVSLCVFRDVHFWCRESFLVWILQKRKYVDLNISKMKEDIPKPGCPQTILFCFEFVEIASWALCRLPCTRRRISGCKKLKKVCGQSIPN